MAWRQTTRFRGGWWGAEGDTSRAIFEILQGALAELGGHEIEEKQGSLHVTNGRAFLGIHPRSGAVLLNLVTAEPIVSARVRKSEQVSRNRWHNEIVISSIAEVDTELAGWLRTAYALSR